MARRKSRWKGRRRGDPFLSQDEIFDLNVIEANVARQALNIANTLFGAGHFDDCNPHKAFFHRQLLENLLIEEEDKT